VKIARLSSCKNFVSKREKFIFDAFVDLSFDTDSFSIFQVFISDVHRTEGNLCHRKNIHRVLCSPILHLHENVKHIRIISRKELL